MAADNASRKTTPSGTIKLKKTKAKLSDTTASRANSPTSSVAGDSTAARSRAFSPDTSITSTAGVDETNKLCKHCKKHYDATTDPNHSKLCLRAKQERQRAKREEKERAERAANGEDVKMEDGSPNAGPSIVTKESTPTTKPKKGAAVTTATAAKATDGTPTKTIEKPTTDKKQTKKRKATDVDTASAAGDSTANSASGSMKPPTKKQKKAAAAAAASRAESASVRGTPAPGTASNTLTKTTSKDSSAAGPATTAASSKESKDKPSVAKPKAPVDVERQCGVPLANGQLCARSLTCKSHAMGAKRSVPGRSLPYDILLSQYQKKNQAKLQKAAMERNAAEEREREGLEGGDGEGGRVDSEEEVERVLGGLGRWGPRPMVEWGAGLGSGWGGVGGVCGGIGKRTREVRFREMLGEALKGNRGAGLFAVAPRGGADGGGAGVTGDAVPTDPLASSDGGTSVLDGEAARKTSMPQGRKSSAAVAAA